MPEVSNKIFTQVARDLERNDILRRKVYPVVPPRVEYELTEPGMSVLPPYLSDVRLGDQSAGG